MTAEVISVGTELLLGQTVDTNSAALGEFFAEFGIAHFNRQTVGDNQDRLVSALRLALSRSDLVVTIGGLGPTQDDMTRHGVAAALDDPLVVDPVVEQHLRDLFARRNLNWVDSQTRQAMRPECGSPMANPNGTAPGLFCEKGGKLVACLPGPPNEFRPMVRGPFREHLLAHVGVGVIHSRILRVCGIGEAVIEKMLGELIHQDHPTVAPYAKTAEVHLRITARADSVPLAEELLDPVEAQIRGILGDHVYGTNDTTLEQAVIGLLKERSQTVSVAESCTGGGLGARLTSVPGSSSAFLGGVISYDNRVKVGLLGVATEILADYGAVSAECATAMADGARAKIGADFGVSITGIAGPDGGSEEKPVGLVYIGVSGPKGTLAHEHRFIGQRQTIRERSAQMALIHLRNQLLAT